VFTPHNQSLEEKAETDGRKALAATEKDSF